MGKWAALVSAAQSARFFISGRHSAIENGTEVSSEQPNLLNAEERNWVYEVRIKVHQGSAGTQCMEKM